jgi:hypothetical protein
MFPAIALSMSAGFVVVLEQRSACIIWPDWQ